MREKRNVQLGENSVMKSYVSVKKQELILFVARRAGHLEMRKNYYLEREEYNSYCLSVTVSGQGAFLYEGKKYSVKKGNVMFFDQNKHHVLRNEYPENWEHWYIYLWGPQAADFYRMFRKHFEIVTDKLDGGPIIENIKAIVTSLSEPIVDSPEISALIYKIMMYIYKNCNENELKDEERPAVIAESYMRRHYKKDITLDDIAAAANTNKYYLEHLYKKVYGVSIIRHLILIRFEQCVTLLKETNATISEVLIETNFNNRRLFFKMCREMTGFTPAQLRKSYHVTSQIE